MNDVKLLNEILNCVKTGKTIKFSLNPISGHMECLVYQIKADGKMHGKTRIIDLRIFDMINVSPEFYVTSNLVIASDELDTEEVI